MGDPGVYLYAAARGLRSADLDGLVGLGEGALRVVEHDGLSAVVSDVDLDEFGDEALRQNLEDLAWLEQVARRHDDVVQAVGARGAVAPLRLATICLDDESVVARLQEWGVALHRALDRVEGRREWSVKIYVSLDEAATAESGSAGSASAMAPATGGGAGAAYLKRRRSQITSHEDALETATELGDTVHARLAQNVVASRRLPPQDRKLTGHEGTMVLNGAYLVDQSEAEQWRSTVETIDRENPHARVELQGPWPPYSFATLDDA